MQSGTQRIKAVFFDLGYTLIYFDGNFSRVVSESYLILADRLIKAGYSFDAQEFVSRFNATMQAYYQQRENDLLERPIEDFVCKILEEIQQNPMPVTVSREAMNEMYRFTEKNWKIEEDTHNILKELRDQDLKLGLITNASDSWDVNNLIDANNLRPYFSTILISADEGIRKPDRRIFEKAAAQLGIDLKEAVMVGDTLDADILGAHNCGMRAIWIKRHQEKQEAIPFNDSKLKPDAEITSLTELPALLRSWQ
jgi:putative hydrolase of the HAD superfamily